MAIRFGVIFIDNNIDNFFNDRRKTKQQLIRSILERKSGLDFIRFIEATASYTNLERKRKLSFEECAVFYTDADFVRIEREIISFLVFQDDRSITHLTDDPSATFNLKNYLLVLAKKFYCSVCYCENINTQKIEWISTNHSDFGEILQEFSDITSLSPNELPQFLANFKFSKSTYGIDKAEFSLSSLSLENMTPIDNLLSTLKCRIKNTLDRYSWHGYSKIPQEKRITQIKKQVSEECKVNPFFHSWRVSSEQNRKVNKIAEDLKSGKIVGEKIIDNVFDINASYCFITPEDLKNLKERLFIQQDIDITHVINQKKGEAFDHILINDIKYNLLDNTFHFIFNVDNSSQLTIKVPRKDLENYELPNTKKDIFNNLINIRRIDENLILKNNEEITNDLNPLLEQLKTQEFPLSDAITKAINQKEKGIVLDYALINDIKYNLLDNTFHFIFNVGNSLLKESSQLIIEVPREALDLENVDRLIENTLSSHRVCFCSEIHSVCSENSLICHLNQGSYIIDLHLIDD
ncbi:hypothetical protein [Helicobacter pylori]|uniref:hypothetical protein n=1 Tax=Helicobacter pylori TaxID=210 RepID=UPI001F23AD64|nr:hypothetical protein [Helicobacter pylori]